MDQHRLPALVVGVFPGQPEAVVDEAVRLAERLHSHVHFVQVDTNRAPVGGVFDEDPLAERGVPIDPDQTDWAPAPFSALVRTSIEEHVGDRSVEWTPHMMSGDVAIALSTLADRVHAELIIVGTRRPTFRDGVRELLAGSVAVRLAHHQHRPLVVVPTDPVLLEEAPG